MINTGNHGIFDRADYIISFIMSTIFIVLFGLYSLFQIYWLTYLIQDYRKSKRFATRIESQGILSPESVVTVKNYKFNAKKDLLLIILVLTESLFIVCYLLGYSYHLIDYVNHDLHWTGLPFNSTCILNALEYKIWVDEMRYPIIGFLLSFSRATFLVCLGTFDYLLKLITNTYVTKSWQFRRKHISVIFVIIISIFLVVIGTIPHTNILSRFLAIFVFIVYLRIIYKHLSFLSNNALVWREQDMLYNVRRSVILEQRVKKRRFILFTGILSYAILAIIIMELMIAIECVFELFLYYGKCIFPVLYGFSYLPPISDEQLPQFHIALVVISCIEKIIITCGVIVFLVPPLLFTCILCINTVLEQRKKRLLTYRFSGTVESGISAKLI